MLVDLGAFTTILAFLMASGTGLAWYLRRRETRASTWAQTFSDMATTVDSLSSALDEERARRRLIEDDVAELKARWEQDRQRLEERVAELEAERDRLRARIVELENSNGFTGPLRERTE